VYFLTLEPYKLFRRGRGRSRVGVVGRRGAEEELHKEEDYLEEEYDAKEDEPRSRGCNLFSFEFLKFSRL
jgi:hypothetical protein